MFPLKEGEKVGKEIIYKQAPCRPDGIISSDGQEESKEGTCRCSINPDGCCVGDFGIILPRTLKDKFFEKS